MPKGGSLTIRTESVDVDEEGALLHTGVPLGRYVMLEVEDTGSGMDQETRSRIFEPFFTTKEVGRGTGLGLATCYGIVSQSGGYITVDSEVGQGAIFRVYLPQVEGADDEPPPSPQVASLSGTETILVVEDSKPLRKLACKILLEKGYQVLEAANADEAISVANQYQRRIHLLLTDVVLPGKSGPALYEKLSQNRRDLKVVFVSGYTDHAVLDQTISKSGASFLQKPFTIEGLTRKIREALEGGE
jgi:CheY-like chemotaxis protein